MSASEIGRNDRSDGGSRWSVDRRILTVRIAVVLGLFSALAIAPKLWLCHDYFGPISVIAGARPLRQPFDVLFLALLMVMLLPMIRSSNAERWIRIWCVAAFLRCVWDRITWQPYLYQYFCMMLVLGWCGFNAKPQRDSPHLKTDQGNQPQDASHAERKLVALRVIIIGVYFWSGFAKFNARFIDRAAQAFFAPLLPQGVVDVINEFILVMPITETLLAIGLLTTRFREISVIGLMAMHVFILWMIGPLGADCNVVVWPWNIVMLVVVPALFWRVPMTIPQRLISRSSAMVHQVVIVLCMICPGLSYLGLWPGYVSFRMYSARESHGHVQFTRDVAETLPVPIQEWIDWHPEGKPIGRLSVLIWADQELGAFVPTELPVYKHIAKRLWEKHRERGDMYLTLEHEPNAWTGESVREHIHCKDL